MNIAQPKTTPPTGHTNIDTAFSTYGFVSIPHAKIKPVDISKEIEECKNMNVKIYNQHKSATL
jgi:hypothetical protein